MLQPAKISLFDFDPGSGLADTLQGILESSMIVTIQRSTWSLETGEQEKSEGRLCGVLRDSDPDLVFVVLSRSNLKQQKIIVEFLNRKLPDLPVIIVLDQGRPDELFGLLELGAKDFITPPLNAVDILPRIRRLLEHKSPDQTLTQTLKKKIGLKQLVGESSAFLAAVVKLLRFLQDKEYRPLGSTKTEQADVRILAASNMDLEQAVLQGKLRTDFYYRLNVIPITLPPLRDRREDVPVLAKHFLEKYAYEYQKKVSGFSEEAIQKLLHYDWPGNVRDLENIVERSVIFCEQEVIQCTDLSLSSAKESKPQESFQAAKVRVISEFEKGYINQLLLSYHGNISRAAKAAHKNRRAFWELIRKHNLSSGPFKSASA